MLDDAGASKSQIVVFNFSSGPSTDLSKCFIPVFITVRYFASKLTNK